MVSFTANGGVGRETRASLLPAQPDGDTMTKSRGPKSRGPKSRGPKSLVIALLAVVFSASSLASGAEILLAQAAPPSLPGPQPTPNLLGGPRLPQGAAGGSGSYAISAAANEHAAFLWVVDNVQHAVVLCEKADKRDFTCTRKPLP
jgi:hypothetical protein